MHPSNRLERSSPLIVIILLVMLTWLAPAQPARAALGWVGNMFPAGGSSSTITVGASFTVYVQVWKGGVTEGAGQGAGITCTLQWATVPYFSGPWSANAQEAMVYNTDIGNNDEYRATITPGVGLYEFTAFCTDTTDGQTLYQLNGNGLLVVDSAAGTCTPAQQADDTIYWDGLGHNSFALDYRDPFGAVPTDQGTVTLHLRTCMDDLNAAPHIRIYDDAADSETWEAMTFDRHEDDASLGGVTYWQYDLSIPGDPSILYYIFRVVDDAQTAYYRDDDPKFYGGGWGQGEADQNTAQDNSFQISVYQAGYETPAWLRQAVIYQVFPERFRNGDQDNDPAQGGDWIYGQTVRKLDWDQDLCNPRDPGAGCVNEYGNQFYGGDLPGILNELDYLQQLGVTLLYLNPIFKSPSNHLYDTTDFKTIDPYFGSLEQFELLTQEAQARGINIILDGVFNHTSSDSLYFDRYARWTAAGGETTPGANDQSGACESTTSAYRGWFYIPDTLGSPGNQPEDRCNNTNNTTYTPGSGTWDQTYTAWWGYGSLPKLQSGQSAVRSYFYDGGPTSVGPYWIAAGASGWRFDVGDDVDLGSGSGNSNGYWAGFRTEIQAINPDAIMLGELWGDASAWLLGDQWDSVMNYRFRSAVLSWMFDSCVAGSNGCDAAGTKFQDNDSNDSSSSGAIVGLSSDNFDHRMKSIQEDYPETTWQAMMNLMGSHDTNRVLFLLKKISADNAAMALDKYKFLGLFQFTYPGAPTIYYGDEAGLAPDGYWANDKWEDDPYNRAVYPWADAGRTPDADLQAHFRKLAVLRGQYPVLSGGDLTDSTRHNLNRTYAYARLNGVSDIAVILLNRHTTTAQDITMSGLPSAFDGVTLYDVLNCSGSPVTCPTYSPSGGSVTVNDVAPLWGAILVEGPLPPFQVALSVADDDIAAGGNTTVTAVVTDLGGQPAADGAEVVFSLLDGVGSLSSYTALVSGGNGQASVVYTAPGGGPAVSTLSASAGTYVGAVSSVTVFSGHAAEIIAQASQRLTIGPATLDASSAVRVTLVKAAEGETTAALAQFDANPAGGADPYQGQMTTPYVDVHLADMNGVTQVEIQVACSGACDGDERLWWWDASQSRWLAFDAGQSGQTGGSSGYVWGRVTDATTPALTDLTGTYLVGGSISPTALELAGLAVRSGGVYAWWALGLSGLVVALAGWVALRRR